MKKHILSAILFLAPPAAVKAATDPIHVDVGGYSFILPLQKADAVQLYSLRDKKGFPGLETVVCAKGRLQLTLGAAPVLGTSKNVPFASVTTRLSPVFFDTSNNDLRFGVWIGKESGQKKATWGLSATVPLW